MPAMGEPLVTATCRFSNEVLGASQAFLCSLVTKADCYLSAYKIQ